MYPNMDMTAKVGFETAGKFSNERSLYGLSEHLFACDMFGVEQLDSDAYIDVLANADLPSPFDDREYIIHLRDNVIGEFLSKIEERVLAEGPTVVGFSSTFNQVMASLALARRLKQRRSDLIIIAGGACFDDEMGQEYHRALPDVLDHVFMGEAENSFREFLRRIRTGEPTEGIPGVTYHSGNGLELVPGSPLGDMNESPMPNYDEFFLEKERLQKETGRVFNIEYLPFESSRGCWWGQKNHCVFCGINKDLMRFREKKVDRVIQEMITLSARYRVVHLTAADWIISRTARQEIFQRLVELDLDIECFYETRADLTKNEIKLMRDSGVVKIQPGIESLSTELLRLMKKGTSRIRHVQFLRWCKEYNINLSYNILAGFPGEKAEWYHEMAVFLPHLYHLQPPLHNMHYVEMHRFSPLFQMRDKFGVDEYQLRHDYCFNFPEAFVDPLKVG
jgi:ribosomal peptide maturation radical SAM protein 1